MTKPPKFESAPKQQPDTFTAIKDTEAEVESSESIKAVAIYEVAKGVASLFAAVALWHWHTDISTWLSSVTRLWHYYFGQLLITQIDGLVGNVERASRHWTIAFWLIIGYASLRFIEAYGLWKDKTWAYWYSVLGYGVFVPIELYYLITKPFDWFKLAIFILNVVIVIVVYRNMKRKGLLG
ncbi:DUF2127 domain-containing protein [Psychrobacter sp. I-STPA10]|uniref:DUF2127 domain-containing protein n=1 Tax=Psychrobacter sp. I-STPA10 TaxID=2585769 RepID=UPI001E63FE8A|nr:DUF2127 domain-containing protein [Psychrobacter sp. I-STPA10]